MADKITILNCFILDLLLCSACLTFRPLVVLNLSASFESAELRMLIDLPHRTGRFTRLIFHPSDLEFTRLNSIILSLTNRPLTLL